MGAETQRAFQNLTADEVTSAGTPSSRVPSILFRLAKVEGSKAIIKKTGKNVLPNDRLQHDSYRPAVFCSGFKTRKKGNSSFDRYGLQPRRGNFSLFSRKSDPTGRSARPSRLNLRVWETFPFSFSLTLPLSGQYACISLFPGTEFGILKDFSISEAQPAEFRLSSRD